MKTTRQISKVVGAGGVGLLASLVVASAAVSLPYADTFSVPPYVNSATVVGQNSWSQGGSGSPSYGYITNDFSGSGRGNSLYIANSSTPGNFGNVYQTLNVASGTDLEIQYDVYGDLPGAVAGGPVMMLHDSGFGSVALVQALGSLYGNVWRVSNLATIPGITFAANTWFTVNLKVLTDEKLYHVTVTDGVSTGSVYNIPYWVPTAGQPALIQFAVINGPGLYPNESQMIDNLSVSVYAPEPSTALLLLLGGAVMLRYRRTR